MIIKIWKEQDLELVSELPKQVKEVIKDTRLKVAKMSLK